MSKQWSSSLKGKDLCEGILWYVMCNLPNLCDPSWVNESVTPMKWQQAKVRNSNALTLRTKTHVLVIAWVMGLLVVTTLNFKGSNWCLSHLKTVGCCNLGINPLYIPFLKLGHFFIINIKVPFSLKMEPSNTPLITLRHNSLYFSII